MTKQELLRKNYRHIGTNLAQTELWARNIDYDNNIEYLYYFPKVDGTTEPQIVSYNTLIEPMTLLQAAFKKEIHPNQTWTKNRRLNYEKG